MKLNFNGAKPISVRFCAVAAIPVVVLGLALTIFWELRSHDHREETIKKLAANAEARNKLSQVFINSTRVETRLLGMIPVTSTYVRQLVWEENLSDGELAMLLEGNALEHLDLAHNEFTASHFRSLSNHKELKLLAISDCKLGVHWKEFLHLTSLRSFGIGGITFPTTINRKIPSDLTHLEHFSMTGETVRLQDIEFLLQPTCSIKSLALGDCELSPEALDVIAKIKSLESLSLRLSKFDGSQLYRLGSLENLTSINLCSTSIEDEHVEFLCEMESLKHIYMWGCDYITVRTRERIDSSPKLKQLRFATFGSDRDDEQGNEIPMIDRR